MARWWVYGVGHEFNLARIVKCRYGERDMVEREKGLSSVSFSAHRELQALVLSTELWPVVPVTSHECHLLASLKAFGV